MTTSPTAVWVVTIRGYTGSEEDEVAAVFTDHGDAQQYANWWNHEETRRCGSAATLTARTEETDYYLAGAWRAPAARPHLIQTPRQHRGAAGNAGIRSAR